MAQKYFLRVAQWDDKKEAFVTDFRKETLYDLDDKSSRQALAVDAVNLLAKGYELKLLTYVDRSKLDYSRDDLF